MTRLEFTKFEKLEDMKEAFNALAKGEEILTKYTKDGETKTKVLCRKGRMYLGNNYSISLSKDEKGNYYLGIDYLSSDDRIQISKNTSVVEETDVF